MKHPDLKYVRLCQLFVNVVGEDPFYLENDKFLDALDADADKSIAQSEPAE